jgi:hypothetical protein
MPQQTSDLMMTIAGDNLFLARLSYLLAKEAVVVRTESLETPLHSERDTLARQIILDPMGMSSRFATTLVSRPAFQSGGAPEVNGHVTCGAEDGTLSQQIAADWNILAGV